MSYSDSQNYPFPYPFKLDTRTLLGVLIRHFPIALYSSLFCNVVKSSPKNNIRTLVLGGRGCRLKAYVHIQGGGSLKL